MSTWNLLGALVFAANVVWGLYLWNNDDRRQALISFGVAAFMAVAYSIAP